MEVSAQGKFDFYHIDEPETLYTFYPDRTVWVEEKVMSTGGYSKEESDRLIKNGTWVIVGGNNE